MRKVKFKKDYRHDAINGENKTAPFYAKGTTKNVTTKHALFLEKLGVASIVTGKEEKEAENRETK
jgi:hypothetical protein